MFVILRGHMEQRKFSTLIICAIFCSALFGAWVPLISHAQDTEDTEDTEDAEDSSYSCTREMAAGLTYNSSLRKWEGGKLPSEGPFSKFILRMELLKERVQRNILDENEEVSDYEVTITDVETNSAFHCRSAGTGIHTRIVVVGADDNVVCSARNYNFTFNLENGRFISVYLHGYVDGIDSNENTPMVSGGACTKIDQTE